MRLLRRTKEMENQTMITPNVKLILNNRLFLGWCGLLLLGFFGLIRESKVVNSIDHSLRVKNKEYDNVANRSDAFPMMNDVLARLKAAEDETSDIKKQLEQAEDEASDLKKQLEQLSSSSKSKSNNSTSLAVFDPSNVCSIFPPSGASSATRLWMDNLPAILEASKNRLIKEYQNEEEWEKIRAILEETISPARMRRAVRHMPTFSHHIVGHVMGILQKRLSDPDKNPPLRIAVFGGSVTIGRGCTPGKRMMYKECAWPQRFELLVNQFFGQKQLIEVTNLGIGGTSSSTGTNMVKYWLYNEKLSKFGPDVIINSYSTNDSLPPWGYKWPKDDLIKLATDKIHKGLQKFIREALESKICAVPPLVVHVDDYLGPQSPPVMGDLSYVSVMTQLAKYYDTVAISYGEVVRDIVYQDDKETTYHNRKDVHFGRLAHTTIALSVGFAALELLINYCDDEYNKNGVITANDEKKEDVDHYHFITKEEMKKEKLFLPPPLTEDLLLNNVTVEFDAALDRSHRSYVDSDCRNSANSTDSVVVDRKPCMISWISSPGLMDSGWIKRFMKTYITANDGWGTEQQSKEGWSNKVGWVAKKHDATFSLRFVVTKKIKTVSIYFLRSYGEKWKDSNARLTISRLLSNETTDGQVLATQEIAGVHADENYHYSLTQTEMIRLSETLAIGEKLDIKVDLVSGSTFKIMGMMLCNK